MQAGMPRGPSGNQVCLHFGLFSNVPNGLHALCGSGDLFRSSFLLCDYLGEGRSFKGNEQTPVGLGLMWARGSRWKEPLPVSLSVWGNCLYCCETAELWTAAMFGLEACCFKLLIPHCSWLDRRVPQSCWALSAFWTVSEWIKERIRTVSISYIFI